MKITVKLTRQEVDTLAIYNSEVSRGLVHTKEWKERMARLQARFDSAPHPSTEEGRRYWKGL